MQQKNIKVQQECLKIVLLMCNKRAEEEEHVWTYLDIREEHLEHVGARVAGVEKHELGLLQMIRGETLLDLKVAAIKDINNCLEGNRSSKCSY